MSIKTLYFTGYLGHSFASKLITWWTRSPVSHVEECTDVSAVTGWGAWSGKKVGILTMDDHEPETPYIIFAINVTSEQYDKFVKFKRKEFNKPYDWPGIMGFLYGKDRNNPKKWFCSEIESAACKHAGIDILNWDFMNPGLVSPGLFCSSSKLVAIKKGKTPKK